MKKCNIKRLISMLLSLSMVLNFFALSNTVQAETISADTYYVGGTYASDENIGTSSTDSFATISHAASMINSQGTGSYKIIVQGDIIETKQVRIGDGSNPINVAITNTVTGSAIVMRGTELTDDFIVVESHAALTLGDATELTEETFILDGSYQSSNSQGSTVTVKQGASLEIYSNTILQDNWNMSPAGYGGAIHNLGTVYLKGGTLGQNISYYGGAIYNKGTLYLQEGTINNNTAEQGGGIYNSGTIFLTGGYIDNNVAKMGGGIYNTGNLVMEGGTISNNRISGYKDYRYNEIGGAIYSLGTISLSGDASIPWDSLDNYVYLNHSIHISDQLNGIEKIALANNAFICGQTVLVGEAEVIASNYSRFVLFRNQYEIDSSGKLVNGEPVHFYVGGDNANNGNDGTDPNLPLLTLETAVAKANNQVRSCIITLQDDVIVNNRIYIGNNITIQSDETARSISPKVGFISSSMFDISEATLTLGGGTTENSLLFQGFEWNNSNAIIAIDSQSTLILRNGVSASNLKMRNFIRNNGTFIMEGGSFQNNEFSMFIINYGSLTMTGGIISDNNPPGEEEDIAVIGNRDNGTLHMNGGIIQNNKMFGIINRGKLTFSDGFITGNWTDIILNNNSNLTISGSAETSSIYLQNLSNYIQLEDNLVDESIAVKLDGYTNGREILRGIPSILESNYEKFVLENTNYKVTKEGKLEYLDAASPIYYVGGADADDEAAGTTKEAPFSSLEKAVGVIGNNTATIILQSDIMISDTILISGNISITSDGTRRTIFRGNEAMNTLFKVNGKLILGNSDYSGSDTLLDLILDGNSGMGITAAGPIIENIGDLFLFPGAVLQNNENTSYEEEYNSVVLNNGGNLHMYGGVIQNNTSNGATIINRNNAKFIMKDGSIKNNESSDISGVFVDNRSSFLMEGGTIRNNRGDSSGVVVSMESEFTMKGGTISGNNDGEAVIGIRKMSIAEGAGVNIIEGSAFIMEGGTISNNSDRDMAGVSIVDSTFHMTGGNIIDNTGSESAGVILSKRYSSESIKSSFIMDGGNISGNMGSISGIFAEHTNIIMNGGTISNNIGIMASGIIADYCNVTMNDGVISGNMADTFSGIAFNIMGMVGLSEDIIRLNGGVIQENKATLKGVFSMNKILMSGKGVITGGDKLIFPIIPIEFGFEFEVGIELSGSVPTNSPEIEVVLYHIREGVTEFKSDIPVGEQIIYSGSGYNYTWEDVSKFKLTSPEYAINLEGRIGTALKDNWVAISEASDLCYDKKEKTVLVTVESETKSLIADMDYTVLYQNNINVGTAQLIILGKGSYVGEIYREFTIAPLELPDEWIALADTSNIIYNGKEKTVEITVFDGVDELIRELDYTVSYRNNTQVGDAELIITGIGNYSGEIYHNFTIEPLELSDEWVTIAYTSKNYYDGKEKTVEISVFNGADELIKDVDYTVSYRNNTKIGDAEVTITGIGNFSGTIIEEFAIIKKPAPSYNPPFIPNLPPTKEIAPVVISIEEGRLTVDVNRMTEETIEDQEEIIFTISSEEIIEQIDKEEVVDVNIRIKADEQILNSSSKRKSMLLKAEILEATKDAEKDLTISIEDQKGRERYTWYFNSNEMKTSKKDLTDVNLYLDVHEMELTEENKNNHEQQGVGLMLDFHHDGELPSQASVRVYVGDKKDIKPGSRIYLYHINKSTGMMETLPFSSRYKVDEEGYIQFDILHCSDYMMMTKEVQSDLMSSLRNQISVSIDKKTIYTGEDIDSTAQITVTLPSTLEIVKTLKDDTSQKAIGGVTVSYHSSNKKVASVDADGRINAKKKGKAIIYATVTLYSGKTKVVNFKVNVKEPYIKLVQFSDSMEFGSTGRFKAEAYGLDIENLIWTTKRKSIVVISKNTGIATAKSKGTDYVIATINDISKEIEVVVK